MGSSDGSKRRTRGISASRGSSTSPSRSRTSSPAVSIDSPHSNSSTTSDRLERDCERISHTPGMTPTASSIGRVTNCSTETGAASGYSVWIVSVG